MAVSGLQGIHEFPEIGCDITCVCAVFSLGEYVCIFDRLFKGAQDSSRKVKNDSLVGKISYSHETATRKAGSVLLQRVRRGFTKERVIHVSQAVWGRLSGERCI